MRKKKAKGMGAKELTSAQKPKLLGRGETCLIRRKHYIKIMNVYYMGQNKEYDFTEQTREHTHPRVHKHTHGGKKE